MKELVIKIGEIFFSLINRLFFVFPLEKKVFFSNFSGKRYGDNPKYISEALHQIDPTVKIVWQKRSGYSFNVPEYVKVVEWPSLAVVYEMATSKVWVDSHLKRPWIKKRKGQYFIETWHGGLGFKKVEGDIAGNENSDEVSCAYHTAKLADAFISNSDWLSEIYRRAFRYSGAIYKYGYPKNDIFFRKNSEAKDKVRAFYQIPSDYDIIMYAPTFRDDLDISKYSINLEMIKNAFEKRFHKQCVLLIRLHPLLIKKAQYFCEYSDVIINATDYEDSQELLIATDYLVTDYSSIIFDFMLMKRPGFLYTVDLENYKKERGLYMELDEYPFSYAMNNKQLSDNIMKFDQSVYEKRLKSLSRKWVFQKKEQLQKRLLD